MGFMKKFIKTDIGLVGKHLMNFADSATGGIASRLVNSAVDGVNKNAGIIGKVVRGVGKKLFNDKTRDTISNIADTSLKYLPKGNIRTALEKVTNAAQGRNDIKTKYNRQLDSIETVPKVSYKKRIRRS